jgi:hypothetical protein
MKTLRLPKTVEAESAAAHLLREWVVRAEPMWSGGALRVPRAELGTELRAALKSAYSAGRIVRGLEGAERVLATEQQGLERVDRITGVDRGGRVSRLVVLAGDGSERFYREVESLLRRHEPRGVAVRVPEGEHGLGELLFGPNRVARLLLVEHKDAVSAVLLALARQWSR